MDKEERVASQDFRPDLGSSDSIDSAAYVRMLLELDSIPWGHSFSAALFNWLLLAGYLVVPGTFTSLQKPDTVKEHLTDKGLEKVILSTIQNPPLLMIACFLFLMGVSGMFWLGWTWRYNYIWVINRIFFPGLLHSAAGLITTLINVYTAQSGDWSVMAISTVAVTGLSATSTAGLFLYYNFVKLGRLKKAYEGNEELPSKV
ncbi:hypothetical protein I7I51_07345 [Histoplasma capsulatum]|uniref:Uncharacterized protein n=1 Tax=Ajellomyces capsulatus TaxID=5037 RepID=A0A8A1MIQ0_AJECA|nr:hypothetical protein I7I51_07345 [Histoplasma capsulatum]